MAEQMGNSAFEGVGFIMRKQYKLMNKDKQIGFFIEDYTDFGVKLRIELDKNLPTNEVPFTMFEFPDSDGVIDNDLSWFWVKERVVPPTREFVEDNLREMDMSEYSPLAIFHYTQGRCGMDRCWVSV